MTKSALAAVAEGKPLSKEKDTSMSTDELNFLQFLQSFRRGDLVRQADGLMSELMTAIQATGGKGKLVLEMPFGVNKSGQIECIPKMKLDKPIPSYLMLLSLRVTWMLSLFFNINFRWLLPH